MLLATGLFLLGIESGTHNDFVCLIIGFLLHYIWLAVFTWTLCNGIFIIFLVVIAVMTTRKIYPYLIVFGWTFPFIIPTITIAVTRENYVGPSEHCFLNINYGVIWAFISPIIILLLINLILLTLAVIRIVTARAKAGEDQRLLLIKNSTVVELIFILLNGGMGLIFFIVGAAIANAVLQDYGIITPEEDSKIIDRNKLRRSRFSVRKELANEAHETINDISAIYFDGRKDQTRVLVEREDGHLHKDTANKEHYTVLSEPGNHGEGQFNNPHGIGINVDNGDIYVCDYSNNRIQIFSQDYSYKSQFGIGKVKYPQDIQLTKDIIFVLSYQNQFFYSFNYNLNQVQNAVCDSISKHLNSSHSFKIDGAGQLLNELTDSISQPTGVTPNSKGGIVVVCYNNRFLIF
ncbi:hypothetical protein LOD99_11205 [Oopsacas minuta]|uniref:G-protein coupled receptors family 2 profile 2 domain-containing protein n=1 Tax=Oopsacas minuta TaxID=111878 RepID=A0AAV7K8G2_9METZ|nr:hypothetical protein LOD99_11205 [Oopsacas minuta]